MWVVVNIRTMQIASGNEEEIYLSKLEARVDARGWNKALKEKRYRVYELVEDK